MYTTYGSSDGTIVASYERWLIKHKNNENLIQHVNSLLKEAIREACIYDNIHENDPLNDIIQHIDHLAGLSIEWDRGFHSTVPPYYALISSNCINCVLFSLLFHGIPVILLIGPRYVNEFKWDSLRDILPFTDLKHIAIKVNDYMHGSEPENPSGIVVGKLWCLESNSYYAVVQEDHSYEEPEHGWPETIENTIEVFCSVTETETMAEKKHEWNSQPKLSSEEACSGFIQKRRRYDEYEASKNKRPTAGKSNDTIRKSKKTLPIKRILDSLMKL